MKPSRRELALLMPALPMAGGGVGADLLSSAVVRSEDVPARRSGMLSARQMLRGSTRSGFRIDLHESELPPGEAPHPPHHHIHEEILLVREGVLEITINGRPAKAGPGSVVYVASNQEHGWRNAGSVPARYFVMALGDDRA